MEAKAVQEINNYNAQPKVLLKSEGSSMIMTGQAPSEMYSKISNTIEDQEFDVRL